VYHFTLSTSVTVVHFLFAIVIRDEEKLNLHLREKLVVGDIVDVTFGDPVPADIRVIGVHGFKVRSNGECGIAG
jgi:magnesium-transporting ATPase (P-type)